MSDNIIHVLNDNQFPPVHPSHNMTEWETMAFLTARPVYKRGRYCTGCKCGQMYHLTYNDPPVNSWELYKACDSIWGLE